MLKGRPPALEGPSDMAVVAQPQDRPRKKLSFREPEIMGYYMQMKQGVTSRFSRKGKKPPKTLREAAPDEADVLPELVDEEELESQAMRVVRTVGQAFEVCHKLSVSAPEDHEPEPAPSDDHSDLLSSSDKPRKDFPEPASSDTLAANDSLSTLDAGSDVTPAQRPLRLDIIPPPPNNHPTRRSPLSGGVGETYSSPLSEPLKSGEGSLSAHHELQLLREQLEQQNQQTQAAVAQVHLLRDQLAAETAARLEAQARTHQLLVHNKELLDHISALVAHLQETERHQQQQQQQHVTSVPQSQSQLSMMCDPQTPSVYLPDYPDLETLPRGLLDNRNINQAYLASGVPGSPRQQRQVIPNVFNFGLAEQQFQTQLLQRLQNINPSFRQSQYLSQLTPYPQQNQQSSPQQQFNFRVSQASSYSSSPVLPHKKQETEEGSQFIRPLSQVNTFTTTETDGRTRLIVGADEDQKDIPRLDPPPSGVKKKEPGKAQDHLATAFASLSMSPEEEDRRFLNGPFITRSTSEKVPNRSELMSQVQRTAWARHTTK